MNTEKRYIVLSQLPDAPLPAGLYASVMSQIFSLRRRAAFVRSIGLATISTGAGVLLWDSVVYIMSEASSSGFLEYIHLLATDSDVALSMWRELATAVIRSAPLMPVAIACTVSILFVWSLNRLYQNIRTATQRAPRSSILANA